MNVVALAGNLTRDPELRYTNSGTPVCSMRIAVDVPGDEPLFLDLTAWEKLAEVSAESLRKGSKIAITGSLRPESWTDAKTNEKRTKIAVRLTNIEFMSPRPSDAVTEETPSTSNEPSLPF